MYEIALTFVVFIITLIGVIEWQKHSYWNSLSVPGPTPFPLIGHVYIGLFDYRWDRIDQFYKKFKSHGFWGMYEFFSPCLFITDPKLIRNVVVKDADSFIDRRTISVGDEESTFTEMLSTKNGPNWKALRSIITPTFTSGKIKAMFPLIITKGDEFISECEKEMTKNGYVDLKSLSSFYTLDAIASCAFGIDAKCLSKHDESDFIKSTANLLKFNFWGTIKFFIITSFPKLSKALKLNFGDFEYLEKLVESTIEARKKTGTRRGDFLDLLFDALKEHEAKKDVNKYPMTMKTVIAQCVLFLFGGLDTTGNALGLTIATLAKHREEQKKARQELMNILKNDGELTYHNIMEAQYLEACVSEALRLYPPAHFLERKCTKEYKVPGTDLVIPKEMIVGLPAFSYHRDPDYWEEPLDFRPERFLPENKGKINPYMYMPFGLGPRNCIAMRFAQMQLKIALAMIILHFDFKFRDGFNDVTLDVSINTLRPNKDGIQLNMTKIDPHASVTQLTE